MTDWAVVISKPSQERKAFDQLKARGFQCFLPFIKYRRKVEPLFPRYLFTVVTNTWQAILATVGVAGVVRCGMTPSVVNDQVIEELRSRCSEDGLFMAPPRLYPGIRALVSRGPFADQLVEISRMNGSRRVEALMMLLGGKVRVDFDEDDLIAV